MGEQIHIGHLYNALSDCGAELVSSTWERGNKVYYYAVEVSIGKRKLKWSYALGFDNMDIERIRDVEHYVHEKILLEIDREPTRITGETR